MKNPKKDTEEEILSVARERFETVLGAYSNTRIDQVDDLRFLAGSSDNRFQWPDDVLNTRSAQGGQNISARPCLTINKLPQHVNQITNDQRQNRPSGKVIPADDGADVEVAEILDGMVRHIEYISDADVAYDTACGNQVAHGEGYVRLLTKFCDDKTFNQDIFIGRIQNSFSVYLDPMIQDPCGSDAKWAFITQEMTPKEYKSIWPDSDPISSVQDAGVGDETLSGWVNKDLIRIAEYFYVDYEMKTLNLYEGGATSFKGTDEDFQNLMQFGTHIRQRQVRTEKVKWCKINGYEILEKGEWPGKYIPIVRIIGNEFLIQGRKYISGIVRNAKDPQRMYNYWVSQEAEMLALAPKAPFIGYGGQFEGYENQWKTANTVNYPYLEVNANVTDANNQVLPLPQRAQPPLAQTGLIQAKLGASDDIKAATGQYDSSLGQTSNERSGKAILARERQVDTGTYHYVDNYARGVRYLTRQIIDLVPKIYDTERIARIIGEDKISSMIKINPDQPEPVKKILDEEGNVIDKIYNPGVGTYDVCVTTGPSYLTKRQESLESMAQLLQGNPELWAVAGDLFIKNMDWPGAQEIAKRFAKTIDPSLISDEDESPQLQAAQKQIQMLGEEVQKSQQMLINISQSFEAQELKIKAYDAETKRLAQIQSGLDEDQIQQIVIGTIHSMMETGDIGGSTDIEEPALPSVQEPVEGVPEQV